MSSSTPKDAFERVALAYAQVVDTKPIHVYYERPNLLGLLPSNLKGLKVLDLGCGSGWYAEQLINAGAKVTALDASPTMVKLTQQRLHNNAKVYLADLEEPLDFIKSINFDVIIAPLVIHYIKDWYELFKRLAAILKPDGQFIFSTHVPYREIDLFHLENYFQKVQVTDHWEEIGEVKFYHHTLQELTEALREAGFTIERLLEPQPLAEMQQADPQMYADLIRKPWFLFVKAIKK